MKRLAIIALLSIAAGTGWSQKLSQTTVFAKHPQAQFEVDGKLYSGLATFTWPEGSTHYLRFLITDELIETGVPTQYLNGRTTRLIFQGWRDDAGVNVPSSGLTAVIQANAAITQYEAVVTVEYLGSEFAAELPCCPGCGLVLVSEEVALGKMNEVASGGRTKSELNDLGDSEFVPWQIGAQM